MNKMPQDIVKITAQVIRGVIVKLGDGEVKNIDTNDMLDKKENNVSDDENEENEENNDEKIAYV